MCCYAIFLRSISFFADFRRVTITSPIIMMTWSDFFFVTLPRGLVGATEKDARRRQGQAPSSSSYGRGASCRVQPEWIRRLSPVRHSPQATRNLLICCSLLCLFVKYVIISIMLIITHIRLSPGLLRHKNSLQSVG